VHKLTDKIISGCQPIKSKIDKKSDELFPGTEAGSRRHLRVSLLLRLDQALATLGWYRMLLGEALLSKTRVSKLGLNK